LYVVSVNKVVLAEGWRGGGVVVVVMAQGTSGRVGEPVPCLASIPPGFRAAAVMEGVHSIWTNRNGRSVISFQSDVNWK
jgi:hypothetical protein